MARSRGKTVGLGAGVLLLVASACESDDKPEPIVLSRDVDASVDAGPELPIICILEGPDADVDRDGYSEAQGDCNDCTAHIGPGGIDLPGNGIDEDCDGEDAQAFEACDTDLAMEGEDAFDGARAIGLCTFTEPDSGRWGVLDAAWVTADGSRWLGDKLQRGILPDFGAVSPRAGGRMLALSTGVARAPDQPAYTTECDMFWPSLLDEHTPPAGFPKPSPACPQVDSGAVFDPAAFEVRIRIPHNVNGISFDSNFHTYEYPQFICTPFNDYFVAILEPIPENLEDGNIVFDQDGNTVSVNNTLLQVCKSGYHGGREFACPLGPGELAGTSFDGTSVCGAKDSNAATGWLTTTVPVIPGSVITLRFAIWDSGDSDLDSLVLVDNFQWVGETVEVIETIPIRPE